jgi:hypothetical protein
VEENSTDHPDAASGGRDSNQMIVGDLPDIEISASECRRQLVEGEVVVVVTSGQLDLRGRTEGRMTQTTTAESLRSAQRHAHRIGAPTLPAPTAVFAVVALLPGATKRHCLSLFEELRVEYFGLLCWAAPMALCRKRGK